MPGMSWPLGWMFGCSVPVDSFWAIHACASAAQSTWPAERQKMIMCNWKVQANRRHYGAALIVKLLQQWAHVKKRLAKMSSKAQKTFPVHAHHSLTWILLVLERLHPLLLAQRPLRPGLSSLIPHLSLLDSPERRNPSRFRLWFASPASLWLTGKSCWGSCAATLHLCVDVQWSSTESVSFDMSCCYLNWPGSCSRHNCELFSFLSKRWK